MRRSSDGSRPSTASCRSGSRSRWPVGFVLGTIIPSLNDWLEKLQVGTVSLPIAIGLLVMMYPVLAKVRYEDIGRMSDDGVGNWRFFGTSLLLSWVVGPALMFALAWTFLADQPAYRTGVIIVGLARCTGRSSFGNDIALGDRERAAVLVVFNALFQVAAYALLGYFYLTTLPGWLGLDTQGFEVGSGRSHERCSCFSTLAAGFFTRRIGIRRRGREWYEQRFIPQIAPWTLYGLHDRAAIRDPGRRSRRRRSRWRGSRCRCSSLRGHVVSRSGAGGSWASRTHRLRPSLHGRLERLRASRSPWLWAFGATSGQALAGVVGPLIEVPVLVALRLRRALVAETARLARRLPTRRGAPHESYPEWADVVVTMGRGDARPVIRQ